MRTPCRVRPATGTGARHDRVDRRDEACSTAAAEPAFADGVTRGLAFAEELLVVHHGMRGLCMGNIGLIVGDAYHQACGLPGRATMASEIAPSRTTPAQSNLLRNVMALSRSHEGAGYTSLRPEGKQPNHFRMRVMPKFDSGFGKTVLRQ